jgi:DinB family protein
VNDTTPADEQTEATPARPANPRVVELIDYVVRQRSVLLAAVSAVPEAERDIPVTPDAWSVAGVLEHLHRVETGIARLLVRSVERARASGLGAESEASSLLGSLDAFELVQRGRRMEAPGPVLPRGEYNASQALMALAASRNALLAAVREGDGLALGEIIFPHPLLGPLNLYQWVLFVGQHEARHADQIAGIGRALGGA